MWPLLPEAQFLFSVWNSKQEGPGLVLGEKYTPVRKTRTYTFG
jgi:hypothetical protein